MKVEGVKEFDAAPQTVWDVLMDPSRISKLLPGVEGFEVQDDKHWSANVKVPLGMGGLKLKFKFEVADERPIDYAAVDDCGVRIHPQIVEGQVHGATAHGLGAALHETFAYDEDGQLMTANFYEYHVPHALDMPPIRTGYIESPSPFSSLGTKGMGEGGGAAIHAVCAAIQDALRSAGIPGVVSDSHNPPERVWRLMTKPEESRALVEVVST